MSNIGSIVTGFVLILAANNLPWIPDPSWFDTHIVPTVAQVCAIILISSGYRKLEKSWTKES